MAEQEPVEKENIVELHAIEHDKIPAKAAATRNSGRPNRLKQRKIDKRKTLKTDVFKLVFGAEGEIRTLARFLDDYSLSRGAPSASWVLPQVEK